jgi:hypothetical protein
MSETVLRIPVSELNVVRVTCLRVHNGEKCGATVEVPLGQLSRVKECPVCEEPFSSQNPFAALKHALQNAAELEKAAALIEFVVPAKPVP